MTIDWHNHWLSPRVIALLSRRADPPYLRPDAEGRLVYSARPSALPGRGLPLAAGFTDIDGRLAHLNATGISRQVISWPTTFGLDPALDAAEARTLYQAFNEDLAALVAKHPDRFSGLAALATADIEWSTHQLEHAFRNLGLIGAVLPVGAFHSPEGAQALRPLFAVAQKYRGHIYLHTGGAHASLPGQHPPLPATDAPGARWALDCAHQYAAAILTLTATGFLDAYPDVSVQLAMLGGAFAFIAETIERRLQYDFDGKAPASYRRVFVDTGVFGESRGALALAVRVFGAERVLFGSDYPLVPVDNALASLREIPISDTERQTILTNGADLLRKLAAA